MALPPLGSSRTSTGDITEAPNRSGAGRSATPGARRASTDRPSTELDILSQLARLRNLIAADQIDHSARRGTYLDLLL
ncbi:hypothetical protein TH25_15360 [Thalassospira profundimaris]|jgi:hypothetical protein|uniref:Uncharacterized protein n=1 Tax=Thalassospira profundimaris TaxID=502049 RepID=A0A367X1V2_9PROT|nr:hypothetical protein [Thalassospira profundimaris]RCK47656.1 hypothetical protein TH25_15360 [Thalassospira profundimaris]